MVAAVCIGHRPLGLEWLTIIQRLWSLLAPLSGDVGKMILREADKQLNEKDGEENWQEDLAPCPQPAHHSFSLGSASSRPAGLWWAPGTRLDRRIPDGTVTWPNHSTFRGSPFWALDPSIIRRTLELVVFQPERGMLVMQSRPALGSGFLEPWPLGKVHPLDLMGPCYPIAFGARPGF